MDITSGAAYPMSAISQVQILYRLNVLYLEWTEYRYNTKMNGPVVIMMLTK